MMLWLEGGGADGWRCGAREGEDNEQEGGDGLGVGRWP
jgi:hypothetical protein